MMLCRVFRPFQCSFGTPKKAKGTQARMCIYMSGAAHPLERDCTYLKANQLQQL